MKAFSLIGLLAAILLLPACASHHRGGYDGHRHYHGGPPPHAPAHGYRAKHRHHDMVYDSRLGAYVVLGYRDHYYHDGWYFRYFDGFWQISAELGDRRWREVDRYRVPEGLRYSKHRYRERDHRDYRDYRDKRSDRDYDDHRRHKDDKKRAKHHDDYDDDRGKGRGRGHGRDDWDD
jgi:hypothetical protein